jgi:hypothetical protein
MLTKNILLAVSLFVALFNRQLIAQNQENEKLLYFSQQINAADLKKHLYIIAGDEFQGRETGREGQKLAAKYLKEQFEEFGLMPGNNGNWFQTFYLIEEKPASILQINNKVFNFYHDFYFFPPAKDTTVIFDEIVFAGYGIESAGYNDFKNLDLKNKAVLILAGEPRTRKGKSLITGKKNNSEWSSNVWKKIQAAQKYGAALILVQTPDYEKNIKLLEHYINKPSCSLKENEQKPERKRKFRDKQFSEAQYLFVSDTILNSLIGKNAINEWIAKISSEKKPVSKTIKLKLQLQIQKEKKEYEAENVLAYIEGSDKKDEFIIITAHYDHLGVQDGKIYYGADDDGTGTVALIELAQAFQYAVNNGYKPRRSLLIMPVSGEEKGLFGSYYYSKNPVFPLKNTVANLNIDMIGRTDSLHTNPEYVYVIGSDMLSKELDDICKNANATYTQLELDYRFNKEDEPNRFYYRSDHYNFARNNIPVIFFFSGVHADYHKPTDTVDKINFEKVEKVTRLIFFTAWELLNREERIKLNNE